MYGKILLFIRNQEVIVDKAFIGRPLSDGVQTHWCTFKETFKTQKILPKEDAAALKIVKELANEKGLVLEIHDVSSFKGKIKAKMKGVKTTPTVIIGKQRIEGVPTKEQLLSLLNEI